MANAAALDYRASEVHTQPFDRALFAYRVGDSIDGRAPRVQV